MCPAAYGIVTLETPTENDAPCDTQWVRGLYRWGPKTARQKVLEQYETCQHAEVAQLEGLPGQNPDPLTYPPGHETLLMPGLA